jgi:hypothetical protein
MPVWILLIMLGLLIGRLDFSRRKQARDPVVQEVDQMYFARNAPMDKLKIWGRYRMTVRLEGLIFLLFISAVVLEIIL